MSYIPVVFYSLSKLYDQFEVIWGSLDLVANNFEKYSVEFDEPGMLECCAVAFVEADKYLDMCSAPIDVDLLATEAAEEPYFTPMSTTAWIKTLQLVEETDEILSPIYHCGSDQIDVAISINKETVTVEMIWSVSQDQADKSGEKTYTSKDLGITHADFFFQCIGRFQITRDDWHLQRVSTIRYFKKLFAEYSEFLSSTHNGSIPEHKQSELVEIKKSFEKT